MTETYERTPLSVLIISPAPSAHGGVAAFIETMKKHAVRCNITSLYVGRAAEDEMPAARIIRVAVLFPKLIYLMFGNRFDVVHINPSLNYRSLVRDGLILLALRMMPVGRLLVYFHGWDQEVERHLRQVRVVRGLFVWLLGGVGRILVLSPDFRQALIEMGISGNLIGCTSTMYDESDLQAASTGNQKRQILFLSRFDRRKGVYELLEAFLNIAADFPDTELVLAGDGAEINHLREIAGASAVNDRIRFCGYVRGEKKAKLLQGCYIFALPTYYPEGMPVALLEAMAAGKPVLASGAGGIRHIMKQPENGIMLKEITAASVENALRRLLADPEYCAEIGVSNATYARNRFEAKIVTAHIENIYHEISCNRV